MMSFIGIGVANVLVKGPFRTDIGGVARTDVLPFDERLPLLFDTRIHLGFVIGVVALLAVHVRDDADLARAAAADPRREPARGRCTRGCNPVRLTVIAFVLSGALIGLSGSVEILGVQGSFRADFNPAYGLLVIPLVFLARLNAIGSLILVIVFSVIQIGGESAARKAEITSDVLLVLVGLMLLFMALTEYAARPARAAACASCRRSSPSACARPAPGRRGRRQSATAGRRGSRARGGGPVSDLLSEEFLTALDLRRPGRGDAAAVREPRRARLRAGRGAQRRARGLHARRAPTSPS